MKNPCPPMWNAWNCSSRQMELRIINKKVPIFLTSVGSETYGTLRNLLAPTNPKDKSFADIVAALKGHFEPKPLIIAERFHFHRRNQTSGEPIATYVAELCRLASKCEFKHRYRREGVVLALGELKGRVAAGRDGLTAEMVSCDILVDFWWCLFNWCWKFGMIPTEWRKSVVVLIPKKQKSGPCRVDEYRGISLVAVPYKALCSIMQKRMMVVVEEKSLVAEEQGGFRSGRGCRDQVITLMLLGQMKARFGKGMFATFIDFRKAYDRVDRKKLWQCLQDSGFGGRILSFLQAAYRSLTCEVKVGEMMTDSFTVSRGLRQGCVLLPLLFSLDVNSLVEKLRGAGVGVECRAQMVTTLLYADDAVLLAENEEQVKRGVKVLEEWCKEWGVEVNVEKSGVMHIRRRGIKRTVETFLLMMRGLELWRSISIWGDGE